MTIVRRISGVVILLSVMTPWIFGSVAAHSEAEEIVEIKRMTSEMSSSHLEADPNTRRLFEIGDSSEGMKIVAHDLDTLEEIESLLVPAARSGFGGKLSAVDKTGHRLFVLYWHAAPGPTAVVFGLAVIDTLHFRILAQSVLPDLIPSVPFDRSSSNGIGIKALSYFSSSDRNNERLYVVSEIPSGQGDLSVSNNSVFVTELDVAKIMSSDSSAVVWRYQLPQCAMTMARESPSLVFRSSFRPAIFVPCRAGGMPGLFTQPLVSPGIASVTIVPGSTPADTSRFQANFFPISGNLQWGISAIDPVSERFFIQADGSTTEAVVWVFDVVGSGWLGAIVLPAGYTSGRTTGLGIDAGLGRMYAISSLLTEPGPHVKVVVSSSRSSVADQGRVIPTAVRGGPIRAKTVVDPVRHRLFSTTRDGYLVFEDRLGVTASYPVPDPDANTLDVDEGLHTLANFSGGAQAFGARIRWVGGVRGVERNVNTIVDNIPYPPYPSHGSRDIHLARVIGATLDNGEASARATAAERDRDNTDNDLLYITGAPRSVGGPDLSQNRWPYQTAACTDFGGPDDSQNASTDGAYVGCGKTAGLVSAVTFVPQMGSRDSLLIGDAWSRVLLTKESERGVVSLAEAEVRGIEIPGVGGIGRISSRAETWAAGRSGRAGGKYDRLIEDVWLAGDDQAMPVCTTRCNPEMVRSVLNQALAGRGSVEFPEPDHERIKGSPKGFESLVVRDSVGRANEGAVNQEADESRLEVPAMVITLFADGRVPSRVVISLGATSAESHYGIYLLDSGSQALLSKAIEDAFDSVDGFIQLSGETGVDRIGGAMLDAQSATVEVVKKIYKGLRFFLASPVDALRAAAVWILLASPLMLVMRRASPRGRL